MTSVTIEPVPGSPRQDAGVETFADVLDRLGGISADRVLTRPAPGTATEEDLLRLPGEIQKTCELIDNTLVRKAVGAPESAIAMWLVGRLAIFLQGQRTALILGPDGHTRYFGDNVRMPDVAIFLRSELPHGKLPKQQVCPIAPVWTVEVLSPGNTKREIDKKLHTFFDSGVRLAWVVDSRKRTVRVYTSAEDFTDVTEDGVLDAADLLPGFTLSVREWFEESE
jgi:Uma2 family endonuclease